LSHKAEHRGFWLNPHRYWPQVFDLLDNGAHMYFCGLKGMMPGIEDMLKAVCAEKGLDYKEWIEGLKHKGQWHVEVY
jgi:ferredoxin--NADP+ reductase